MATDTPIRVAIVHQPYQQRGGEDIYVDHLVAAYESVGIQTTHWPVPPGSMAANSMRALSIGSTQAWDETLELHRPTLVHLNNIHPSFGPAFLRWIKIRNVLAIWTIHNHRFYCANGLALYEGKICKACKNSRSSWRPLFFNCNDHWPKSAYHGIGLAQMRLPDIQSRAISMLIAPSPYMHSELVEAGLPSSKIVIAPHPIPLPEIETDEPEFDVIYAGRLSQEKGAGQILDLARALPSRKFAVAGFGPMSGLFQERGAPPNITYFHAISRRELMKLIARTRVALVPSICEEAFSIFAAEALVLGKIVVTSPRKSLAWMDEWPGVSIRSRSDHIDDFATAISAALSAHPPSPELLKNIQRSLSLQQYGNFLRQLIESIRSGSGREND